MTTHAPILFDLDGTLIDSLRDIAEAMNRTLVAAGFKEHPLDFFLTAIGDGSRVLLQRCIAPVELPLDRETDMLLYFKKDYEENLAIYTRLYAGIETLLNTLEEQAVPKAIFSNKPDQLTQLLVKELLGNWSFVAVQGQIDGGKHKPDRDLTLAFLSRCEFSPEATLMVGDTRTDMDTATSAGMIPVGVSWGFRKERELSEHGAKHIIHTPAQLLDVYQSLGEQKP